MNSSQTWLERPLMPSQTASYPSHPSPSMVSYAKFYMAMGIVAFFPVTLRFFTALGPFSLAIQACPFAKVSIFELSSQTPIK
jgi:hypothetical protein